MRSIVASIVASLLILVASACIDTSEPSTSSASQALGSACSSDCDCPLGFDCNHAVGECQGIIPFSPMLPYPVAGATCQCPYGSALRGIYCLPISGSCVTDCDCGNGNTCWSGTCGVSFSPIPECTTCASRCGAGEVCDVQCEYVGGGTGPGGPDRPGENAN